MTDKEKEDFEEGCLNMLARLKAKDPLFELNMEFGKMLMKNINHFTDDELKRYNELKILLSIKV